MMTFEQFSLELIRTGDLDPDYIFMLNVKEKLGWHEGWKMDDWVCAKSAIYNSASELEFLMFGYDEKKMKFGQERQKSKHKFMNNFKAIRRFRDDLRGFENLPTQARLSLSLLQQVSGIGPWASWKILDLLENVRGIPFNFEQVDFRVAYEFPLKGLLMVCGYDENLNHLKVNETYKQCLATARERWGAASEELARPLKRRAVNIQEFETCLCKYHSYAHKKYRPGQDIEHLRQNIVGHEREEIRALEDCLP